MFRSLRTSLACLLLLASAVVRAQETNLSLLHTAEEEPAEQLPAPLREATLSLFPWKKPFLSLTETVESAYLNKGRRIIHGAIRKDSLYGSWYGFHAGIWSYSDLEGKTRRADGHRRHGEPAEFDYYFGYGHSFGEDWPIIHSLRLTVRYNYYDELGNPKADSEDWRFYLTTGSFIKAELEWRYTTKTDRNIFGLRFWHNFEVAPHWFWNHSFTIWAGSAGFCGSACPGGWRTARSYKKQHQPLGDCYRHGLYSYIYTTALEYQFNKHCAIGPHINIAWGADHNIREGWRARANCNDVNFNVGFSLRLRY